MFHYLRWSHIVCICHILHTSTITKSLQGNAILIPLKINALMNTFFLLFWPASFSLPHRDKGLSRSHTTRTDFVRWTGLATFTLWFQADKTELHVAARTVYIFAELSAMFHLHAACRTGSDRGAVGDPLHLGQTGGFTCLQKLQVPVDAAVIVAAVRSRPWTFPLLLTLPAELVGLLLISCTYGAPHTQVGEILPLHTRFALWALMWKTQNIWKSVHLIVF